LLIVLDILRQRGVRLPETRARYRERMFDVADSLRAALEGAHQDLLSAQAAVARSAVSPGGRSTDAAMAGTARAAIFTEALLEAEHARLAEIKAVTK
jgi:hypothetical protein